MKYTFPLLLSFPNATADFTILRFYKCCGHDNFIHSQLTTVVPFIKKCVFPEPMFCDGNSVGTSMTYKCCM